MAKGWISIHRQIWENWTWKDKPFSKGQAWIDILLMVNYEKDKVYFRDSIYDVERGQKITSELKLSDRWGWSRTKVRRFLNDLEMEQMLLVKRDNRKTVLEVVNYSKYQDANTTENTSDNTTDDTTAVQQKNINNNINKDNKLNKVNKKDICTDIEEEKPPKEKPKKPKPKKDKYGEFEKVSLTNDEFNKLLDKLGQARIKEMIARLDTYKASTGKRYSSDYATILNWHRKDVDEGKYNDKTQQSKPKSQQKQSNLTDLLNMIEKGAFDE